MFISKILMIFKGNIADRISQILTVSCSLKTIILFFRGGGVPGETKRLTETEKSSFLCILTRTGGPKQSIVCGLLVRRITQT